MRFRPRADRSRRRDAEVIDSGLRAARGRLQPQPRVANLKPDSLWFVFRAWTLVAEEGAIERHGLLEIGHAQHHVVEANGVHDGRVERHASARHDGASQSARYAEELKPQAIGIANHADACGLNASPLEHRTHLASAIVVDSAQK